MEYTLGYREVIPDQTVPDKWKEIIINTGGSQSTLQDIKVPERAGGYSYKDPSKYLTRNRFIYWRISHDILELIEHSLDINLVNNRVRYKFSDTPILDGISVHETSNAVIILVITVSSIHKFSFPHPEKDFKQDQIFSVQSDCTRQSIFGETSTLNVRDPHTYHVIPNSGSTNHPVAHAAASWLTIPQEDALFALAYNSGIILLLRLDTDSGLLFTTELRQESIVPRFLSGLATAIRGRVTEIEVAVCLVLYSYCEDTYLCTLSRGGNLRIWSCNKGQCIAVADVSCSSYQRSVQNHNLKLIMDCDDAIYVTVFLKYDLTSEFYVFKVIQDCGIFKLNRICTLLAPDQHLVDFSFTLTRLWAVWRTSDIDNIVVTHARLPLQNGELNSEWESALLVQYPDKDYLISHCGTDPRQTYINYIFNLGKFSLVDITRALNIYRRCSYTADVNLSPDALKEKVCMAVEAEIQSEVMDYELMDEDYLEIVNRCWSKFYSCVLQYHINGSRPVGLLLLSNVYGVVLLKRSIFSLLRPMEALEHLMLSNHNACISKFKNTPVLSQDNTTCQDVIALASALIALDERFSEDLKSSFDKELYHLKSPDVIVEKICSKLLFCTNELFSDLDFQSELYHRLENIKDLSSAMAMLLEALTYDLGQPNKLNFDRYSLENNSPTNHAYLFGSDLGISTISKIVSQIINIRFSICRNLLFLQHVSLVKPELFDSQSLHAIKSSLTPRTVVLTQAYYTVQWICESNVPTAPSQALLNASVQRISLLKLRSNHVIITSREQRSLSLLEMFIHYGAKQLHYLLDIDSSDKTNSIYWHIGMLSHVTIISQLIWPISGNFFFPDWLLCSCQFVLVQEYVRLLNTWCEWNGASRKFIMGVSYLEMGEPQKACDYFLRAASGVTVDDYLSKLLLNSNSKSESNDRIYYYLKIIELLEQHNAFDCVIEIAKAAVTESDDCNLPTLHSVIFSQHLNLQHHIEAYNCLNTNPDVARRVDCLRQLVVTLFNRKKLSDLVIFPYVDMYDDLEKIMEARARSVDLMENNYYDFLYSFHINKGNVRKAATVMYEQAIRLSQEPQSIVVIARQANCLLACINALYLVHDKYRWIVRPTTNSVYIEKDYNIRKKRSADGKEISQHKMKKQIEVLELNDIKKEYALVDAKFKIANFNPDSSAAMHTNPSEVIAILSRFGFYEKALHICELYSISKSSVLENLVNQCVSLSYKDNPKALNWLNHNYISDFGNASSSAADISWRLLELLTASHEKDMQTELHKVIATRLLHRGEFLPEWLFTSYAQRNAPELLRLLIQMGRLEEATNFCLEYINAILGKGTRNVGLSLPMLAIAPPVCFPINALENLLLELQSAGEDDQFYVELSELLQDAFQKYLQSVERVSIDMIHIKISNSS